MTEGPSHPDGCGGIARSPELLAGLSSDVHVVLSRCPDGRAVLTSTDGVTWTRVATIADIEQPRAVVQVDDVAEIVDPQIDVNGRRAGVDTRLAVGDGSVLVLLSDPGKSTGFFCG